MIYDKKEFYRGVIMMVVFFIVLVLFFMPLYHGQNGLNYMDSLYNSISKGSAYFIPELKESAAAYDGQDIAAEFSMPSPEMALRAVQQLQAAQLTASASAETVTLQGDLGMLLAKALDDADIAFNNDDASMQERYGTGGREALYSWWLVFKGLEQSLKDQKLFKEAKSLAEIGKRGIETSYNFHGITPEKITSRLGLVIFSLLFYVIYTLWYGYAILFMFEGWGLRLSH